MNLESFFHWLDMHPHKKSVRIIKQLSPIIVCLVLFIFFMIASYLFIVFGINPVSVEKIQIAIYPVDVAVGFFIYFITAIDYALIVGRMQITNSGSKARFIMNVFTCVGCFAGVSIVLFIWGFAKEIPWAIIPILIFAGSVMIKLAYEGIEYFENTTQIPVFLRNFTIHLLQLLYKITRVFTFWMPELGNPSVKKMRIFDLAKWSFFLPFIIGLDDFVGYMGAMTIYNVFSLLIGIYLADILIDILIFVSPKLTKKLVENAVLSLLAAYAFLYLAYKSISESYLLLHEHYHISGLTALSVFAIFVACVGAFDLMIALKKKVSFYPSNKHIKKRNQGEGN